MIDETELEDPVPDLTFKARALAQAHPLSSAADRYRQSAIDVERAEQPLPEFADWAATAFLVGYCVRRVEEAETGVTTGNSQCLLSVAELGGQAIQLAQDVRNGRAAGQAMFEPGLVEALLNRVITTEIEKRADHWKPNISDQDWADFESYIAWWTIHGYALRAAEVPAA